MNGAGRTGMAEWQAVSEIGEPLDAVGGEEVAIRPVAPLPDRDPDPVDEIGGQT